MNHSTKLFLQIVGFPLRLIVMMAVVVVTCVMCLISLDSPLEALSPWQDGWKFVIGTLNDD